MLARSIGGPGESLAFGSSELRVFVKYLKKLCQGYNAKCGRQLCPQFPTLVEDTVVMSDELNAPGFCSLGDVRSIRIVFSTESVAGQNRFHAPPLRSLIGI